MTRRPSERAEATKCDAAAPSHRWARRAPLKRALARVCGCHCARWLGDPASLRQSLSRSTITIPPGQCCIACSSSSPSAAASSSASQKGPLDCKLRVALTQRRISWLAQLTLARPSSVGSTLASCRARRMRGQLMSIGAAAAGRRRRKVRTGAESMLCVPRWEKATLRSGPRRSFSPRAAAAVGTKTSNQNRRMRPTHRHSERAWGAARWKISARPHSRIRAFAHRASRSCVLQPRQPARQAGMCAANSPAPSCPQLVPLSCVRIDRRTRLDGYVAQLIVSSASVSVSAADTGRCCVAPRKIACHAAIAAIAASIRKFVLISPRCNSW